jgi:hypothetical protein
VLVAPVADYEDESSLHAASLMGEVRVVSAKRPLHCRFLKSYCLSSTADRILSAAVTQAQRETGLPCCTTNEAWMSTAMSDRPRSSGSCAHCSDVGTFHRKAVVERSAAVLPAPRLSLGALNPGPATIRATVPEIILLLTPT